MSSLFYEGPLSALGKSRSGVTLATPWLRRLTPASTRLGEPKRWDQWPVVTEEMKVALEEEGATGLAFRLVS